MKNKSVLLIGDANVDLTFWKKPEGHATNAPLEMAFGGTAANTAIALSRLDIPASLMGMIGDDSHGKMIRTNLEREGVDTSLLFTHPELGTILVIYAIDEDGKLWNNTMWPESSETALYQLTPDHIQEEVITKAAWLHVVGFLLLRNPLRDTVLQVLEIAHQAGVPISLDMNLRSLEEVELEVFRQALERAIGYANVVFGSDSDEFDFLYPSAPAEEVARRFASESRTIVIRMAEHGSKAVTPRRILQAKSFPVEVVSPIGAGDVFNAGFIAARLGGGDIQEALRRGNAAAALKIGRAGPAGAPSAKEVLALMGR